MDQDQEPLTDCACPLHIKKGRPKAPLRECAYVSVELSCELFLLHEFLEESLVADRYLRFILICNRLERVEHQPCFPLADSG